MEGVASTLSGVEVDDDDDDEEDEEEIAAFRCEVNALTLFFVEGVAPTLSGAEVFSPPLMGIKKLGILGSRSFTLLSLFLVIIFSYIARLSDSFQALPCSAYPALQM